MKNSQKPLEQLIDEARNMLFAIANKINGDDRIMKKGVATQFVGISDKLPDINLILPEMDSWTKEEIAYHEHKLNSFEKIQP